MLAQISKAHWSVLTRFGKNKVDIKNKHLYQVQDTLKKLREAFFGNIEIKVKHRIFEGFFSWALLFVKHFLKFTQKINSKQAEHLQLMVEEKE